MGIEFRTLQSSVFLKVGGQEFSVLPYFYAFPHFLLFISTEIVVAVFHLPCGWIFKALRFSFQIGICLWILIFIIFPQNKHFFSFSGLDSTFVLRPECSHEKQTESESNRPLEALLPPFLLFWADPGGLPPSLVHVVQIPATPFFLLRKAGIHAFH